MPAVRNVRRSRRLSKQPPTDVNDYWQFEGLELLYPSPEPETTSSDTTLALSPSVLSTLSDSSPDSFVPRSSHSRKKKADHVLRPRNAFIIYRSDFWAQKKVTSAVERDHRQISRIAGLCWNRLSEAERAPYKERAALEKARHARLNPGYKYTPTCRKGKTAKRRVSRDGEDDEERCRTLASLLMNGVEGQDLEKAVKMMKEEDPEAESAPLPSRRSRPRRPRPSKRRKSTHVKVEALPTPEILFSDLSAPDGKEFVPTEDIPPLDLSSTIEDKKPKQEFPLDLQPPNFSPDYVEAQFGGIKPEESAFTQQDIQSLYENDVDACGTLSLPFDLEYPSDSEVTQISLFTSTSEVPITFENPFTSQSFYAHDFTLHNTEVFGGDPVSPTTVTNHHVPSSSSSSSSLSPAVDEVFAQWFNFDAGAA